MRPLQVKRFGGGHVLALHREDGGRYTVLLNGELVSEADFYFGIEAEFRRRDVEVRALLVRQGMRRVAA